MTHTNVQHCVSGVTRGRAVPCADWPVRLAVAAAALLLAAVAGGGCAGIDPNGDFDYGFIASRDTNLQGHRRLRALGPLYESRTAPDGTSFTAVRPLYSRLDEPYRDRRLQEFLWPVGMHRSMGKDVFWRFLLAYGNDFDRTNPESRYRAAVFPFVFWGRSAEGQGYFAVFPLGGRIREYLGRDEIDFALFPLYVRSQIKSAETHTFLFPLISWTRGGRIDRSRFLPFYGRVERPGRWEKTTIMWPFWTSAQYDYPGSRGYAWILFPLIGRVNTETEKTWMFLPPFFRYGGSEKRTEVYSPWPFVRYLSGDIDKLYIWPLWGTRTVGENTDWFAAWPIMSGSRVTRGSQELFQWSLLPLLHYERVSRLPGAASTGRKSALAAAMAAPDDEESDAGGGEDLVDAAVSATSDVTGNTLAGDAGSGTGGVSLVEGRYFRLWPLFSYRREDQLARVRMIEAWPIKDMAGIERNWSPLWTLYTHARNDRLREDELLWGLFRYRRDDESVRNLSLFPLFRVSNSAPGQDSWGGWSVLMGLFGYEKEGLRKTLRLLYIPIRWGGEAAPNQDAKPDGK